MRSAKNLLVYHGLKVTFALWALSLVMPTGLSIERLNFGYEFLGQGFIVMVMWIAFAVGMPLHFLAWASNFMLLWCAIELTAPKSMAPIRRAKRILTFALIVNLSIGVVFGWPNSEGYGAIPGLLLGPAYWFWSAAFAIAYGTALVTTPIQIGENTQ